MNSSLNLLKVLKRAGIAGFALAILILVSALPAFAAEREDETHTFLLEAADAGAFDITFGGNIAQADPGITDPSGEALSVTGTWQYEEHNDWHEPAADRFFAGTWRYYIRIELDETATVKQEGEDFPKYDFFDDDYVVKVGGDPWETIIYQDDDTLEHFLAAASPEPYPFTEAEDGGDLIFIDSPGFDIPKSYPGEYIWPFSVANYVSGGQSPYTFSKAAGPDWITVDAESGEVSGAPSSEGSNQDLTITVTDSLGASKSITVSVEDTGHDTVSKVKAWGFEPDLFYELDAFVTVFEGEPAEFITDEGRWEKKNGASWEPVTSGNFTAGRWRYTCPLRISGDVGRLSVLDENTTVTVNGDNWTTSGYGYDPDDYTSELTVTSPEYVFDPIDIRDSEHFSINVRGGTYTGEEIRTVPRIQYTYGDEDFLETRQLEDNKDFTCEYKNNISAGTASVTITGTGDYFGTVTRQFEILPADIGNASVEIPDQEFTGQAVEPDPAVTIGDTVLAAGTDYTVSYENNYGVGNASCVITGKGNYTGDVTASFAIKDTRTEDLIKEYEDRITELEGQVRDLQSDVSTLTEDVNTLKAENEQLKSDLDDANKLIGEKDGEISELKKNLEEAETKLSELKSDLIEAGNTLVEARTALEKAEQKAEQTAEALKTAEEALKKAQDTISEQSKAAEELGKKLKEAQAAQNSQSDEYEKLKIKYDTLLIKTTAVKGVKVKIKKGKATVTFKKLDDDCTYKVFYSLKKKGKYKAVNKKAIAKTKVVTRKLKRGKKYYFKVRAYKKINGKTVAGKYSKVKKGTVPNL